MARMRSIPQAVAAIKEKDPDTLLSQAALRRWVKQGKVPVVMVGTRALLNLDWLEKFLEVGENVGE